MRILGLDYGTVRVGVALTDPLGFIAQPKGFIKADNRSACIAEIKKICLEFSVEKIVIGLPLHMNGDEGESAKGARALGASIQEQFDISISFIDERLSTMSANKALTEGNVRGQKKKEKVDSVAAAIILQNYLDRETEMGL
jgi:putative Holliday junction resolvase